MQGCSPGFEYPRAGLPSHIRFVGALGPGDGFAPPTPAALCRSQRTRPLAFVTQGTLRHDIRELVLPAARALTAEGFEVLIAANPAAANQLDRVIGDSVTVVDLVDYQSALAEADLFVTNGGYTGVTLALAAGVPVLQVGATEEKLDIGARLEWAGVGRSVRGLRPGVPRLRRAIRLLMNSPERAEASRRLAREMRDYDARVLGPRLVADLVASRNP
jgi:UDP:flavonoid glycosyltransferase YjiC (YdhE family)